MAKSKSKLVARKEEGHDKEAYQLTPGEQKQYGLICERIIQARNQRETPRDEFDGMSYEQTYLANKRAAMTYLTPKRNDDEVRVNTGTTEKRIEFVFNELLGMNIEGEILAYDKDDNFMMDVSEVLTDIAMRTEQMEQAEDKDIYFYQELLTQPSVFAEELWVDQPNFSWKKNLMMPKRCERRMIQGVQIYLGDINLPDVRFHEQPFLVKYVRMTYEEGEHTLKPLNPDRWDKYVTKGSYTTVGSPSTDLYRKNSLKANEIEGFWYMSYPDNEVQLIVSGVLFFEVGKKYTEVFGDLGGYHITMVGLKPYGWDFAYSKPLTQSAKTLQALDNETIRNLIRKFRQAIEPPLGVPRGKVYSRDIWNPGAMAQGVKATDFERLIDHSGVTRSEMAMFDLIEKKVNEFIGTSQQEPLQNKTQVTATEFTLAHKNAVKMLGLSVLAVMRLKRRMAMLRIGNVLANYTKPAGKAVDPISKKIRELYARFSLEDMELGGVRGEKVIQLTDRSMTPEEEGRVYALENRAEREGKPFRYKTLNVKALQELNLHFYVNATAKPKESNELDKSMFSDMLNQAVGISQITGRPINAGKVVGRFERVWRERDLFEKSAPMGMNQIQSTQQELERMRGSMTGLNMKKSAMNTMANQAGVAANMI